MPVQAKLYRRFAGAAIDPYQETAMDAGEKTERDAAANSSYAR
jgi:hypothetical protein